MDLRADPMFAKFLMASAAPTVIIKLLVIWSWRARLPRNVRVLNIWSAFSVAHLWTHTRVQRQTTRKAVEPGPPLWSLAQPPAVYDLRRRLNAAGRQRVVGHIGHMVDTAPVVADVVQFRAEQQVPLVGRHILNRDYHD